MSLSIDAEGRHRLSARGHILTPTRIDWSAERTLFRREQARLNEIGGSFRGSYMVGHALMDNADCESRSSPRGSVIDPDSRACSDDFTDYTPTDLTADPSAVSLGSTMVRPQWFDTTRRRVTRRSVRGPVSAPTNRSLSPRRLTADADRQCRSALS